MKNHVELQKLLLLAAAGALKERETVEVSQHVSHCAECRKEFECWESLTRDCATLPAVPAPGWLSQKTIVLVRRQRQATEDRRWNSFVYTALAAFSWAMSGMSCYLIHFTIGIALVPLLASFTLFTWITAICAGVIFRAHLIRSKEHV